jgi:transposase
LDLEKKTLAASERDQAERGQWREQIAARAADRFVFVDESSANRTLTPRYARAPSSERASGSVPRNYQHNTTIVAALTPDGIQAAMTLEGALDSDAFAAFVAQVLVPALRPGQVVILDNLSVHKRADIRTLIEQANCELLFLPAYSPDFTPIEQAFSKLKAALRRVQARTQDALETAIGAALATISATDARHWFHHAGYQLLGQPL